MGIDVRYGKVVRDLSPRAEPRSDGKKRGAGMRLHQAARSLRKAAHRGLGAIDRFSRIDGDEQATLNELYAATIERHSNRLVRAVGVFDEAARISSSSMRAICDVLRSRDILPENGVVHVVGPGLNFGEWLFPLVLRPDVRVVVSEPDPQAVRAVLYDDRRFEILVGSMKPQDLEALGVSLKPSRLASLFRMVRDRLLLVNDVGVRCFEPEGTGCHHPYTVPMAVPAADLVVCMNPHDGFHRIGKIVSGDLEDGIPTASGIASCGYEQAAKQGGLIWVTTERARPTSSVVAHFPASELSEMERQFLWLSPGSRPGAWSFESMGFGDAFLAVRCPSAPPTIAVQPQDMPYARGLDYFMGRGIPL